MKLPSCLTHAVLVIVFITTSFSAQSQAVKIDSGTTLTSQAGIINKYSQLLNVPKDSIKNMKLYTLIERYSATPYKYGGNDQTGVDCSGFSSVIEKQVYGLTIPRSTGEQAKAIQSKNISSLKEGDLVFLKLGGSGINHVGVYLQNGFFIHATSNLGIVLDNLNDPDTQQRFVSAGSVK
ncbi:MAG: C40 family peptidase [Sphingobacteriales bacterium]